MFPFLKRKPKIIVICGPTATGKTSLSIDIAKKYNGEVISADSRQVYTGLDIGSAKVTTEEMDGIPHHMIDVADPKDIFSIAQYITQADIHIKDILQRKKTVIVCGGTGMYIDALISGTHFPKVPPNYPLRARLEKQSETALFQQLQKLDSARAQTIDPYNKVRLVRALEVIDSLGVVPKIKHSQKYTPLFIGLDIEKETHKEIIHTRIRERFENQNMLQEAIDLHTNGISYERMESLGLEYRYMARYLQGQISYDEMISELSIKTIQFAKRQRTWFKRNKDIKWFNPTKSTEDIYNAVDKFL